MKRGRVVIVGGGMIGTSIAWWLSADPTFDGTITVVERDPTYARASTSHTNSCIRQQFSNPLNIAISQFGVDFIRNFADYLGGDSGDLSDDTPDITFDTFGYLYLADNADDAALLARKRAVQRAAGAHTVSLTADQVAERWPFIRTDDLVAANFGARDEGYFDSGTMFAQLRRAAKRNGVTYLRDTVTAFATTNSASTNASARRVTGVRLASGARLDADWVVNAAGPTAADVAAMVGIDLPVEPRKRFTWVFRCATQLAAPLPLTIDPSGVHVRQDGPAFMAGAHTEPDGPADPDDFAIDDDIFENVVWPALVHRVPAFEQIKVTSSWAGHYAYNTLDQNAVIGPHPELDNFVFANGFSGHGLQQAPAVGRGIAEWISRGEYRSLDLSPLGFQRILDGEPFPEVNVI